MLANGNSRPEICAFNLLRTVRGEIPLSRMKGIDRNVIDAPENAKTSSGFKADAAWVIKTYEPRAAAGDIDIDPIIESAYLTANLEVTRWHTTPTAGN